MIEAWVGYDDDIVLILSQDGEPPLSGAISRAIFSFGPYCLDTDEHPEHISLINNAQDVRLRLGLFPGLGKGTYTGYLTLFDASTTNGMPWGDPVQVVINLWKSC